MLDIKNISKTFGIGTVNEKKAISDLSLHVNESDFITIIGANGAGKSTLFNAIAGTFLTDSGEIFLGGKNITLLPEYKRAKDIGRLFQDPMFGTAPDMSVEENLVLAAGHGGWLSSISSSDRKKFRETLALLDMGLEDRMSHPVGLLSGGQRQALTLIMATINKPKLLLLDEHTAALDPAAAEKVLMLTKKIIEEGKITCLMITHNMQSAIDLGNRLLMMENGKIIYDISGEEKKKLVIDDLISMFQKASGKAFDNDRMLLSTDEQ